MGVWPAGGSGLSQRRAQHEGRTPRQMLVRAESHLLLLEADRQRQEWTVAVDSSPLHTHLPRWALLLPAKKCPVPALEPGWGQVHHSPLHSITSASPPAQGWRGQGHKLPGPLWSCCWPSGFGLGNLTTAELLPFTLDLA